MRTVATCCSLLDSVDMPVGRGGLGWLHFLRKGLVDVLDMLRVLDSFVTID